MLSQPLKFSTKIYTLQTTGKMLNVLSQKHDVIKLFTNSLFRRQMNRRHHSKAGDNNSATVYFCCSSGQAKARSSVQFSVQENYNDKMKTLYVTCSG